jgi:hypothetical protein
MISIILDTNIWITFVAKNTPTGLLEQLKSKKDKFEIILLSNEIILNEWLRNKEQTIKDVTNSIKGSFNSAKKIADYFDDQNKIDYLNFIDSILGKEQQKIDLAIKRVEETEILLRNCEMTPITDEMKLKITDWALAKKAPFKKKDNSVGDALILLSSVEYQKTKTIGITDSIFVSFNHDDYADGKNTDVIHEDLQELIAGANMTYKRNIGEALNLTPLLTKEIEDYIDFRIEELSELKAEIIRGK